MKRLKVLEHNRQKIRKLIEKINSGMWVIGDPKKKNTGKKETQMKLTLKISSNFPVLIGSCFQIGRGNPKDSHQYTSAVSFKTFGIKQRS